MGDGFLEIAATASVQAAQRANGSREMFEKLAGERTFDRFTDRERAFIAARDSFYLATVSETGWPYVQHRGGPPGFVRMLDDRTLAFADFRGNRQYITLGNLAANDRACLFFMDYANRRRLKLYARVEPRDLATDPDLAGKLALPGYKATPQRALLLHLVAFDWNCPQHITPRLSEAELAEMLRPLHDRLTHLEAENRALQEELAAARTAPPPTP